MIAISISQRSSIRFGAVLFESLLVCFDVIVEQKKIQEFVRLQIDHDVCSNYGNWVYVAGVGNDPRENRHFNMIKQAFDYDSDVKTKRSENLFEAKIVTFLLFPGRFCANMVS